MKTTNTSIGSGIGAASLLITLLASPSIVGADCVVDPATFEPDPEFTSSFLLEHCSLKTSGVNPYFILKPGYQLVLEGEEEGDEGPELVRAQITVLPATEEVDGVLTRVVEEREWVDGELVEVSRNFFVICKETKAVYYFGEEVDDYEDGVIVGHSGEWRAGENGAQPGLIMPGTPLIGASYYQEVAPFDEALDKGQIESMEDECEAGDFDDLEHCVTIIDTSDCDPDAEDEKVYAHGIGLVVDEELELISYGMKDGIAGDDGEE